MGAAIAEFKRSGMADADVSTIVAAAGVAHGTFFFHFPTKQHVLLELEQREEERIAKQLGKYADSKGNLSSILNEAVRLVVGLERRLGAMLFKGKDVSRHAAMGLFWLTVAKDAVAKEGGGPDDKWITDTYSSAFAQATEDERILAHSYLEGWMGKRR